MNPGPGGSGNDKAIPLADRLKIKWKRGQLSATQHALYLPRSKLKKFPLCFLCFNNQSEQDSARWNIHPSVQIIITRNKISLRHFLLFFSPSLSRNISTFSSPLLPATVTSNPSFSPRTSRIQDIKSRIKGRLD